MRGRVGVGGRGMIVGMGMGMGMGGRGDRGGVRGLGRRFSVERRMM